MLSRVCDLLAACGTVDGVMPPTVLYNEGWMLRLVLDWFARRPRESDESVGTHPLTFEPGARWYSEVLLGSRFKPRHRGDSLGESWTHADGAVGHFAVGGTGRGDLALAPDARQLVIIEAKMFSGLSAGTKNAPTFDQAARSVACVAEALARIRRAPEAMTRLGFCVIAPREQLTAGVFGSVTTAAVVEAVRARVAAYDAEPSDSSGATDAAEKRSWLEDTFRRTCERISITVLAWEDVVAHVAERDEAAGTDLGAFLHRCLQHNRPAGRGAHAA
jgi:hypothetical protein